jgi:hypothetical protein
MGRWPTYMNENLTSVTIFDGVAETLLHVK